MSPSSSPTPLWRRSFDKLKMSADDGARLLWLDFGGEDGEIVSDIFPLYYSNEQRYSFFYDRGRNTRWVENLIDQERWLLKQAYLLNQPRQFFESNAFRPTNSLIILQWLKLVFNVIQKKLWGKKSVVFRITNFNQENVETQLIAFFPSWYKSTLQRSSLSLKALLPNRVHIFSPFSHRMTNGRKLAIKKYRAGADVFDNNATRERTYCERSLPLSSRRGYWEF